MNEISKIKTQNKASGSVAYVLLVSDVLVLFNEMNMNKRGSIRAMLCFTHACYCDYMLYLKPDDYSVLELFVMFVVWGGLFASLL